MKKKSSSPRLLETLFSVIPEDAPVLLGTLAHTMGIGYGTLKRWVPLIERIQKSPKLKVIYLRGGKIAVQLEKVTTKETSPQPVEEV